VYLESSVLSLPIDALLKFGPFSKVYMYEALQHFALEDLDVVLEALGKLAPSAPLLFGSVPMRESLWRFYDTPERRGEYRRRVKEGTEAIGTWWDRDWLTDRARRCGYEAVWLAQDPMLHTSHYRMDLLMRPAAAGGSIRCV
jgi:hypothetical protein